MQVSSYEPFLNFFFDILIQMRCCQKVQENLRGHLHIFVFAMSLCSLVRRHAEEIPSVFYLTNTFDRSAIASSAYISKVSEPNLRLSSHLMGWSSWMCLFPIITTACCVLYHEKRQGKGNIYYWKKKKVACEINAEVSCCTQTPGCLSWRLC